MTDRRPQYPDALMQSNRVPWRDGRTIRRKADE